MAIHTLSIDVETFSGVDLKKCGVYKYAESPDVYKRQLMQVPEILTAPRSPVAKLVM